MGPVWDPASSPAPRPPCARSRTGSALLALSSQRTSFRWCVTGRNVGDRRSDGFMSWLFVCCLPWSARLPLELVLWFLWESRVCEGEDAPAGRPCSPADPSHLVVSGCSCGAGPERRPGPLVEPLLGVGAQVSLLRSPPPPPELCFPGWEQPCPVSVAGVGWARGRLLQSVTWTVLVCFLGPAQSGVLFDATLFVRHSCCEYG